MHSPVAFGLNIEQAHLTYIRLVPKCRAVYLDIVVYSFTRPPPTERPSERGAPRHRPATALILLLPPALANSVGVRQPSSNHGAVPLLLFLPSPSNLSPPSAGSGQRSPVQAPSTLDRSLPFGTAAPARRVAALPSPSPAPCPLTLTIFSVQMQFVTLDIQTGFGIQS
jgi:hypothetical protein